PPVRAAVGRLEHASSAGARVEGAHLGRVPSDSDAAPTAVGSDIAPFERPEQAFVHWHSLAVTRYRLRPARGDFGVIGKENASGSARRMARQGMDARRLAHRLAPRRARRGPVLAAPGAQPGP